MLNRALKINVLTATQTTSFFHWCFPSSNLIIQLRRGLKLGQVSIYCHKLKLIHLYRFSPKKPTYVSCYEITSSSSQNFLVINHLVIIHLWSGTWSLKCNKTGHLFLGTNCSFTGTIDFTCQLTCATRCLVFIEYHESTINVSYAAELARWRWCQMAQLN